MNTATLIRMANQIAHNFGAYPPEVATEKLALHLRENWEKRMLTDLIDYVNQNGSGIDVVVQKATAVLRARH